MYHQKELETGEMMRAVAFSLHLYIIFVSLCQAMNFTQNFPLFSITRDRCAEEKGKRLAISDKNGHNF